MRKSLVGMLALTLGCTVAAADEKTDAIGKTLADAKAEYQAAVEAAGKETLEGLEKAIKEAAAEGDIDTVLKLGKSVEKLKSGADPDDMETPLVADYLRRVGEARARMTAAYEEAVKEYTKALAANEAKAAQEELDQFRATLGGSEGDEVRRKLDADLSDYEAKVTKAREDFLAGFDEAIRRVSDAGNFTAAAALRREKEVFEAQGSAPQSAQMRAAVQRYAAELRGAGEVMAASYQQAVGEYTRSRDYAKAEAADNERRRFLLKTGMGSLEDVLIAGSVWQGPYAYTNRSDRGTLTITIKSREGESFAGTHSTQLDTGAEPYTREVAGVVKGNRFAYQPAEGDKDFKVSAEVTGGVLRLRVTSGYGTANAELRPVAVDEGQADK